MAYVLFCLTILCYLGLAFITASKPDVGGGNGAVGYAFALAYWGLALAVSSLALTITLLAKGNFHWLAGSPEARTGLTLLAWLCLVITAFFCAEFKWEWRTEGTYPEFLHWLAVNHGQIWIPLLWLSACFLSLNPGLSLSLPVNAPKGIFYAGLFMTSLYSFGLVVGYLHGSARTANWEMAEAQQRAAIWHQRVLDDIAAHKPTDSIYGLLSQTTQVRPADTQAAAVAMVKSHPNWEADLLALLKNKESYQQVYYFLDGNAVTHPQQFEAPLIQSMVWLADSIKADINSSNNLQDWSFDSYGIDNLLRAIDMQYPAKSSLFYLNVVRIKQALDTPPPKQFRGVRFTATDVVTTWLKQHKN